MEAEMEEEREQIELMDGERLLTEKERKCIASVKKGRNIKLLVVLYGIFFVLTTIINIDFIIQGEIIIAIIIFLIENIGVPLLIRSAWITADKLAEAAMRNEIYVREAIYINAGYKNYAVFEINRNGKRVPFYAYALIADDVKRGDKVILVQVDEKWKWIYKARADEASEDERKITLNS